jgi:hypothetical protein
VPFALGETIELQDDADVVGQHQRLDLAPQAAQGERRLICPWPGHGAPLGELQLGQLLNCRRVTTTCGQHLPLAAMRLPHTANDGLR